MVLFPSNLTFHSFLLNPLSIHHLWYNRLLNRFSHYRHHVIIVRLLDLLSTTVFFLHHLLPSPSPPLLHLGQLILRENLRLPWLLRQILIHYLTLAVFNHIIRDRSLFSNFISKTTSVGTANFGFLEALGSGDVAFRYPYGDHHVTFTLRGCLFAPTAPINLLSVGVLVERRGMPCLFSPAGITKAFFPSDDPKLPGLVFLPNVTNRMPFLTFVFVSPAPSCPISSPTIPADPSTPSHLSHVSTTASEAHDHLIPPSRLPDFCTAEAAEHLDGAVMSVDVAGIGVVVDVLNGCSEDLYVDVVLNGGVDTLPAAVSEDVMVAVVLKGVENQAANKCVGDTFNRVMTATGSDSSSSSTLTSPASSLDFPDLDDSIIFHSSTRSYIHHHFPCVLPFNLSSIPNATSKSACFSSSPSSFSYNNSLFCLSPPHWHINTLRIFFYCFGSTIANACTFLSSNFFVSQFLILFFLHHHYNRCMILLLFLLYVSRFLLCHLQYRLILFTLFPHTLIHLFLICFFTTLLLFCYRGSPLLQHHWHQPSRFFSIIQLFSRAFLTFKFGIWC